jgi:hypothetical protein
LAEILFQIQVQEVLAGVLELLGLQQVAELVDSMVAVAVLPGRNQ